MKIKVVVHKAEEGGYWVEFPSMPGCFTQGDTFEELLDNIYEVVELWFTVDDHELNLQENSRIFEVAI